MPRIRPPRLRHRDRTRGQSLVEFALVLPILILIFAAAADLGRVFYGYVALENAVKEGAVFGSRYPLCDNSSTLCPDPDNVVWRVENEARNLKTAGGAAQISPTSQCLSASTGTAYADLRQCVPGDTYKVTATITFSLITPLLNEIMGGGFTLTSESRAIVLNEAFDPTPGLAPTKLVLGTAAKNASELAAKCQQPDPVGSPGYYRSPCLDVLSASPGPSVEAKFEPGDTITYKLIVRNNGGTTVTSITMTDTYGWPGACPAKPGSMAVNATPYTCTYTRPAPTPGAGTSMEYTNTLTVDGLEIDPAVDAVTVHIDLPPAKLRVLKFVSPYALGDDGDGSPSFGINDTITLAYNATTTPFVWYKIAVTNTGGQTATGVSISDSLVSLPYGANSATQVCDAKPTTLAVNATFICRYRVSYSSAQVQNNTASATATNVTTDSDDTHTATVTVASCAAPNMVVPNLIGKTKTTGPTAWTTAGFTGTYTNISSGNVVTQNVGAFTCKPISTAVTVTNSNTP
ncbi:MAG TPA: TadE/TadG family type IV pilus assembly protein [Candidatus Limnocylindrales bacterium]